jgi:AraC-like DNA-binding protein
MKDSLLGIIYLIPMAIVLAVLVMLTFRGKLLGQRERFYLGGYFLAYFLAGAIAFVVLTPLLSLAPHLFRTGNLPFVLIFPFSWLYFKEMLKPGKPKLIDLLILLPFVIYVLDYFPFFVQLSAEDKLAIARSLNGYGVKVEYREGWFVPAGGHNLIRNLTMAGIWLAQANLYRKHICPGNSIRECGHAQLKWLRWLLLTQPLMFLPTLVTLLMQKPVLMASVANVAGLISVLFQGYFLLLHPELLFGTQTREQHSNPAPLSRQVEPEAISNPQVYTDRKGKHPSYLDSVDEDTLNRIHEFLENSFTKDRQYLNPQFKLADLSVLSGFSPYKLSAYFKKRHDMPFNDYINQRRVVYSMTKLQTGEHFTKTLEAIASECGFHSRTTFIRAFKKLSGKTPSDYIESLNDRAN